ncbi:glycosyltransferase involved in cell wall biosynthesis [Saccharothrix tamanrassetensis]|uniref:Glycosyltransferase involved in cell wall biosynthesis n=1 Tax=Saccharothrix tamanrassetensis TaxID=1051531 RepID=A0A841CE63_9PSEU|nr:glycosyltransferase [Saccharothrix tamanrassetensis]MBB5956832.1 glycosyltransferase involved in cell wall biosynthesis [Saccharothrix tamanrassetensis]
MSGLWVVVPAYNEERGITATLDALAAQDDPDFTLLVVDNGSTDSTADTVRAYAERRPGLRLVLAHEPEKGTGAAADTGMRHAIDHGARWLARTDADCLPAPDWTARIKAAFDSGLRLVSGQLLPRKDEGLSTAKRGLLVAAVEVASLFGRIRPDNRDPRYLGPYVMTAGCNMAITAELYALCGGFPRSRIEDLHEDRALVNAVRLHTRQYGLRRDVLVYGSSRRAQAWGLRKTLAWYADHRYRPAVVDIR